MQEAESSSSQDGGGQDVRLTVMEAIASRKVVEARYNRETIRLAPHLLFQRHGDLFISALNLGKTWRSDEDPRLGQFKLIGLAEARLIDESFDPLPDFTPDAPREDDVSLLAI